jgi:hypothetical protein
MSVMFGRVSLLVALLALMLVSPASISVWQLAASTLKPVAIPSGASSIQDLKLADFDADGLAETLRLLNGRATIWSGDQVRWQSPENWQVRQALIADPNRDGRPEAILLVWRPFKPWPIDEWLPSGGRINRFHDSAGMSCHLILIGWREGSFRERWAGSALAEPINSLGVADLNGTGEQFLVTLEYEYGDPPSAPARRLKVWEWNGFGFTVVSEMEGPFSHMSFVLADGGQTLILVP